jgi:hypothetical protein
VESIETLETTTFSGRRFTRAQLAQVQETVGMFQRLSRHELAQTLCEHLEWISPNKSNKFMSCLKLLEELEERGIIKLPAKRQTQERSYRPSKLEAEPEPELRASLEEIGPIELKRVITPEDNDEYKDYLRKYHYLGFKQAVGNQIAYLIVAQNSQKKLGCLLFSGSATYTLEARDRWIGWDEDHRKKLLHLILRNNRFLILPWVKVPHLASKALSMVTSRIGKDWLETYGVQPVLIDTFVDKEKYTGSSYQAANWQLVGETTSQKKDDSGQQKSIKDIYLYPLQADFKQRLLGSVSTSALQKQYRNDLATSRTRQADNAFVELWKNVIQIVQKVAEEYDAKWRLRKRVISTMILVLFIFRLISSKKATGYGTIIDELWDSCKSLELPLPQKESVAPSSMHSARQKLDEHIFRVMNQKIIAAYEFKSPLDDRWMGHSVFAVDGSKLNLPRDLLNHGYHLPTTISNYPQGLLSCLYQLKTKIPYDFELFSKFDERVAAEHHLSILKENDVVVYDRGYPSYWMLHVHMIRGIHGVFRFSESSFNEVRSFFQSTDTDIIVTITGSDYVRRNILKEHKDFDFIPIKLRLVKYTINETTYCLGTTLLDPKYTVDNLAELYHARWGVEELYKVSKRVFLIEDFHAKSERGVKQELYAHFVLITMNRFFSNQADLDINALRFVDMGKKERFQTNFTNCINVFSRTLESLLLLHSRVKEKIQDTFRLIASRFSRIRPERAYARQSMKPNRNWQTGRRKRAVAT